MSDKPVDTTPYGDMHHAVQMLAADNARLCEIGLAADKLAEHVERLLEMFKDRHGGRVTGLAAALDAYRIVRNGQ